MNNTVKMGITLSMLISLFIVFSGWESNYCKLPQSKEWIAPASADKIVNPLKSNEKATKEGKKIYIQFCSICHGNLGKGDGLAAISLSPRPGNFTTSKVQNQSDGAIFWKMSEGRAPMASYKEILKEDQRWQLVNYIRTLKK